MNNTTKALLSAVKADGLFARNWSSASRPCFAIYAEGGEAFIGTVELTGRGFEPSGPACLREKAILRRLCDAAKSTEVAK